MAGKNWNSKEGQWSNLVKQDTRKKAKEAQALKKKGVPVSEIAERLKLSKSRIYELLKG